MSLKFHHSVVLPFWPVKCERLVNMCSILFNDDNPTSFYNWVQKSLCKSGQSNWPT